MFVVPPMILMSAVPAKISRMAPVLGQVPQVTLTGFEDGTYYIAATAFDTDGNESEYSEELGVRVSGSEVTTIESSDSGGGSGGW